MLTAHVLIVLNDKTKIFGLVKFKEIFLSFFTEYFADYKRLRGGVYFVDEFPLTPSGKVMRRKVKEIAIEMYENENGEAE